MKLPHEFAHQRDYTQRGEWSAAIAAAEELSEVAEEKYVYRSSLNVFPFTLAHAQLMRAEIFQRSGDAAKAREAYETALSSWEAFKKSRSTEGSTNGRCGSIAFRSTP